MATATGFKDTTLEEIEFSGDYTDDEIYSESIGVLKFKDAQKYLRLSKAQLYLLVRKKKIPFFHLDSETKKKPEIRFVKATLNAWLKQREAETMKDNSPAELAEEKLTINDKDLVEEYVVEEEDKDLANKSDGWVSLK